MKRTLLTLFMAFCATFTFAQSYTVEQETLRRNVNTFLSGKGLHPEIQNDGLKFKSEGKTYYVEISEDNSNPFYLRLCMYVNYNEKMTRENVMGNLNSYNVNYGVRTHALDDYVKIAAEMFVGKASDFTSVFDRLLFQVNDTFSLIK